MKKFIVYTGIFAALLLLAACGSDSGSDSGGGNSNDNNKTFSMELTVGAASYEQVLELTQLNGDRINTVTTSDSWISINEYPPSTASAPKIGVKVSENKETKERKGQITVNSRAGSTLFILITQSGSAIDVDTPQDEPSDQPAYAPRR